MDDDTRPHRARVVDDYPEAESFDRMEWPSRSLDCNPIEHVWDMFGRAMKARINQPRSVRELARALQEEWARIPQHKIRRLISSTRRRCQAAIKARGSHTRY